MRFAFLLLAFPVLGFAQPVDVLHYTIQLDTLDYDRNYLSARTTVDFVTTADIREFALELRDLTVRDVLDLTGKQPLPLAFVQEGDSLWVEFPGLLAPGEARSILVAYSGTPAKPARFGGVYFKEAYTYNLGVLIGNEPPSMGKAWFPCVDNFTDKATYEIAFGKGVPETAVASGLRQAGGRRFVLKDPIPTYLAAFAVGGYAVVRETYKQDLPEFGGQIARDIPVELYVRPSDTALARATFANLPKALAGFEERFGPYRWPRVGYVSVPMPGGAMEHATNVAFPHTAVNGTPEWDFLWAHELSHSWFGNLVTCSSPSQMWLNEGFARYCEALYHEIVHGDSAFKAYLRATQRKSVLGSHTRDGYLAVADVPLDKTYSSTVYDKGATVVHTLRKQLGDARFFAGIRAYLDKYAFGNASITEFFQALAASTGQTLDTYEAEWVRSPGWTGLVLADFSATGQVATVQLREHRIAKPVPLTHLRVPIRLFNTAGAVLDTVLAISPASLRTGDALQWRLELPWEPVAVFIDPDEHLCDATLSAIKAIRPGETWQPAAIDLELTGQGTTTRWQVRQHLFAPQFDTATWVPHTTFWELAADKPAATARVLFRVQVPLEEELPPGLEIEQDQLELLYRPNGKAAWQSLGKLTGPVAAKPGQYTVAFPRALFQKRGEKR